MDWGKIRQSKLHISTISLCLVTGIYGDDMIFDEVGVYLIFVYEYIIIYIYMYLCVCVILIYIYMLVYI